MGGYTGVWVTYSNVPYVSYHRPGGNVFCGYGVGTSRTIETLALGLTTDRGVNTDYCNEGSTVEHVAVSFVEGGLPVNMDRAL